MSVRAVSKYFTIMILGVGQLEVDQYYSCKTTIINKKILLPSLANPLLGLRGAIKFKISILGTRSSPKQ